MPGEAAQRHWTAETAGEYTLRRFDLDILSNLDIIPLMETAVSARTAILMALIQGKGFGLELIERVKDRTRGKISLHQGSVYPLLRDMEDEGLLRSWDGEPSEIRAGRPRRYYELTADGLRAAREQGKALASLLKFAEML